MGPGRGVGTHSCVVCKKDKKRFSHLKFHRFPKDTSRCMKWLSSLNISNLREKTLRQLNSSCVVCSEHFCEDQYINGRLLPSACPVTGDKDSEPHVWGSEDSTNNTNDWYAGVTDQEETDDQQVVTLPRYDILTTGFGVIDSNPKQEAFTPDLANVLSAGLSVESSNHSQDIFIPKLQDERMVPSSPSHSEDNGQDTSSGSDGSENEEDQSLQSSRNEGDQSLQSSKNEDDQSLQSSKNEDDQYLDLIRTILHLGNEEGEKVSVKDKIVAMDLKTLIYIIGRRIVPAAPSQRRSNGQGANSNSESVGPEHEEYQYLDLIHTILHTGSEKSECSGTRTISIFGAQMRFSLRDDVFPLLTTNRVFWQGVAEELLWFIKGSTDAKLLQEKDIHVWDGNSSREFLDKRGFTKREEGDLGPMYGFQWRHFGASYGTMKDEYTKKGIDQLRQHHGDVGSPHCMGSYAVQRSGSSTLTSSYSAPPQRAHLTIPPKHTEL